MKPFFFFSAVPKSPVSFREFFGNKDIVGLLERPGEVRPNGWSMETRDTIRIGDGPCLELGLSDYKLIQFYEDGTLLLKAAADESLLGWASKSENVRINAIALAELTFSFVSLYQRLIALSRTAPEVIRFGIRIEGAWSDAEGTSKLFMLPHGVNSAAWQFGMDRREARASTGKLFADIDHGVLSDSPGRAAYKLLEQIYVWFGFTSDRVPYSPEVDGERAVSPDEIRTDGR